MIYFFYFYKLAIDNKVNISVISIISIHFLILIFSLSNITERIIVIKTEQDVIAVIITTFPSIKANLVKSIPTTSKNSKTITCFLFLN